jgi:hypothetical protein
MVGVIWSMWPLVADDGSLLAESTPAPVRRLRRGMAKKQKPGCDSRAFVFEIGCGDRI